MIGCGITRTSSKKPLNRYLACSQDTQAAPLVNALGLKASEIGAAKMNRVASSKVWTHKREAKGVVLPWCFQTTESYESYGKLKM